MDNQEIDINEEIEEIEEDEELENRIADHLLELNLMLQSVMYYNK